MKRSSCGRLATAVRPRFWRRPPLLRKKRGGPVCDAVLCRRHRPSRSTAAKFDLGGRGVRVGCRDGRRQRERRDQAARGGGLRQDAGGDHIVSLELGGSNELLSPFRVAWIRALRSAATKATGWFAEVAAASAGAALFFSDRVTLARFSTPTRKCSPLASVRSAGWSPVVYLFSVAGWPLACIGRLRPSCSAVC